MNFSKSLMVLAAALLLPQCEQEIEVSIPMFPDGGLLRTGTALSRQQLYGFEGMFSVPNGSDTFGHEMSVRTSKGTVSLLTDKEAGFSVLGAACLPDQRVVLEGYWQYPTRAEAGLVRLFVDPPAVAEALCKGESPPPTTVLKLTGVYGSGNEFPGTPFVLNWAHELKPWRGRFYSVAHHGACEATDHCGASPNSMESVRLAERTGSNAAELDVRMTRDGVPIFFHDPGLSKSLVQGLFCNGQVADLSLAELRGACTLRYGEVIPTVEELLTMMIDETELEGVYLDMKVPEAILPVSRIVNRYNEQLAARMANDDPSDDRVFGMLVAITTDEGLAAWHDAKATLNAEGAPIPTCLLEYDPDKVIAEGCRAWGPTWTKGPRADDVARVRDAGAGTIFWTINQTDFIDQFLIQAQPNGIISARTAMLFHRYQQIGTPPPILEPKP